MADFNRVATTSTSYRLLGYTTLFLTTNTFFFFFFHFLRDRVIIYSSEYPLIVSWLLII